MFLRNCWYVVAWDHEIAATGMLARTVLDEPLLLYRTADGAVSCLEDRCCHRLAPLSKGRREGDCVRCGYHGLKFDARGVCVEVPGMDAVPPRARVRSYPVVTKNRWVFVWMGEASQADTSLLPDNFSCEHPQWHYRPGYIHYDTPYLLICDNLLDFSHLSYVHEATFGGGSAGIAQARPVVEKMERGVRVRRSVNDIAPSAHSQSYHRFEGNVDRRFIYDFVLPGTLLMHSGAKPTGQAEDDWRGGTRLHSCQALTPETETSTHYFFQQAYQAEMPDPVIIEKMYAGLLVAFEEDRAMITAQYRNILRDRTAPMLPLAMDTALTLFRRLVDSEIAREAAEDRPATDPSSPTKHQETSL